MNTEKMYDGELTAYAIEELVYLADADGIYTMLSDKGMYESADYVAEKYF